MSPLLAILAFQAVVIEPAKDPALAKPVTVRLPIAALREVVGALAKASGQPLDVTANVSDLKATVLVKDLPVGRTMEALADALGLVWKKDGAYYRLSRADGSAAAEKEYIAAERQQRQTSNPAISQPQEVGVATLPGQYTVGGRPGRPGRRSPGAAGFRTSYLRFDPNLLTFEGSGGRPPTRLDPSTVTGASEFAKAVLAWPSMPKEIDPAWNKMLNPTPLAASTWENGGYVLGELLASWHDSTGLPVVADAFRLPTKSSVVRSGTALNALQSLVASEHLSLRLADGVARLRNPAFWRLREQEVSESTWNTLERGKPGIDDFATFASRLTVPQAASFRSLESPMSHVRTIAVREAYPALVLWTALPTAAHRALLAGTPVGIATVKNATNAYLFALREAPYYGAGDPTPELAMAAADLGMFGKSTPNNFELRLAGERGGGVSYLVGLP